MKRSKVPINWDDLEVAVERNAPHTESFLDLSSGQVLTIVANEPETPVKRKQVADHIANYVRIEPASSREQYRWMERFVASVADDALRERLIISIDGKGAFRRFKDVLLAYPAERERWFSYRADLLHWHVHNWLENNQIEPDSPAPWGLPGPPPELPQVTSTPIVHGTEPPGEALRRQARELIDGIPAIDLPGAIAFLEFLRERGVRALAQEISQYEESLRAETEPGDELSDSGDAPSSSSAHSAAG
ncbi:UPF0158 family protein [Haliangium ochraceum]|uniref:Uncharacterized protein n=1 Tax=Haliangium ochraceum (strain DSM 14365 / JCM 11303 / SMP-2) TaxID=502025 RepID=D0LYQ2_HALO1|nr:UPF0158 family protein [Haliangium ochraceum]ACY17918.1 conserved hypothetical protein [Haliangium ochraceum DSM 14365]